MLAAVVIYDELCHPYVYSSVIFANLDNRFHVHLNFRYIHLEELLFQSIMCVCIAVELM